MLATLRRRLVARARLSSHAIEELERRTLYSHAAIFASTTFVNEGRVPSSQLPTLGKTKTAVKPNASLTLLTGTRTPAQIDQAYGVSGISFGATAGTGAGQTIAIIDAFNNPNIIADAATFNTRFGLQQFNNTNGPTLTVLNQTAAASPLPANASPGVWDLEEALDVQWAHSVAPQANIVLFEANGNNISDLYTAAQTAAAYPGVSVVSMSFGNAEFSNETAYDSFFVTPAGHQGVTFLASTGDTAEPGSYPAYSPNVVAVGGTAISINSDSSYNSETGWSSGGGGISKYESQPLYQTGKVNGLSSAYRTTPDVSMDASPSTGVYVLDSYAGGAGAYYTVGGTSLAAPLWAGLVSIVNQGRVLNGSTTFDGKTQTLPALYSMPSTYFHDVTSGNNGFTASSGYDLVTGLGSPIANGLVPQLAGYVSSTHLAFVQQPTNATAGSAISPAITVAVLNAGGNIVTTDNSSVTLLIAGGPWPTALSGTSTVKAVNGVATFSGLSLTTAGSYVLYASDGTMIADSAAFTVTPAAAASLVFVQQPVSTPVGVAISPAVTLQLRDVYGNVVTSNSSTVSLSLSKAPTGGTLSGTTSVAAVNGVATFSNLILSTSGTYMILANGAGLSATSSSFTAFGAASQLVFGVQPTATAVGGSFGSVVTVDVEDAAGTIVANDVSSVTLSIASGPTGASLGGNITVAAVNGVATFPSAYLNDGGTYTLRAADGALTAATSSPVIIAGSYALQTLMTFTGTNGSHPDGVPVADSAGDFFFTSASSPTGSGAVWEVTAGSTTPTLLAAFTSTSLGATPNGLVIDAAGDLFGATGSGGAYGMGTAYEIVKGTSAITVLASLPNYVSEQAGGSYLMVDAAGNVYGASYSGGSAGRGDVWEIVKGSGVTTSLASLTASQGQNPETNLVMDSSGNLYGTTVRGGTASYGTIFEVVKGSGVITTLASFSGTIAGSSGGPNSNLIIDSAGDLFGTAADNVFELVKGSTTIKSVAVFPSEDTSTDGLSIDSSGDLFGATNSLSSKDTGTVFEIPAGTTTIRTLAAFDGASGAVTFGVTLDGKGNIFGVNADGGNLDFSLNKGVFDYGNVFELKAPHLVFTQQPTAIPVGGTVSPAVTVAIDDAFGNVITTDNATLILSLTGAAGGTLSGTTSATTVNGIATFSNLSITPAGTYALAATYAVNPRIAVTSNTFIVGAVVASKLAFGQQPTGAVAGNVLSPSITVYVEDGNGNLMTGENSMVTLAVSTGPGAASGTLTAVAVNGVATFSNVVLTTAGAYTLVASDGNLIRATTTSFTISPAALASLTFVQSPTLTAVGAVVTPAVTVRALDAYGNVATGDTSTVTISIASGTAGALAGTLSVALVNGVATFSNLSFTTADTYTLKATDGAATAGMSSSFNVYLSTPTTLLFTVQPSATAVGQGFTTAVAVEVFDQTGAAMKSSTVVTLSLAGGPIGGTIGGPALMGTVNGIATFTFLEFPVGGTYTLRAVAGSASATSNSFVVTGSYVLNTLLNFDTVNGTDPRGIPVFDAAGDLFVSAFGSGTRTDYGSILEMPAGSTTFNVIARFNGTSNGEYPNGIVLDAAGNIFGTTYIGGRDGYVFEIPKGTSTIINLAPLTSQLGVQGGPPLLLDSADNIYGTSDSGGSAGLGYIWELPVGTGSLVNLGSITGSAKGQLRTNLVMDSSGNLYGTTFGSGSGGYGSIFEVAKGSGVVTTLASFTGIAGSFGGPEGTLLIDSAGNLYGTSLEEVFELVNGSHTITNLADTGRSNQYPQGLVMDSAGNFFGGFDSTPGSLFELPAGSATIRIVAGFDGLNGTFPTGLALDPHGNIYGISGQGGPAYNYNGSNFDVANFGYGTVFELIAPHLTVTQQPITAVAGANFSPSLAVSLTDAYGNLVTTEGPAVTLSLTSPTSGSLGGTTRVTLTNGTATFSTLNIQKAGVFTIRAVDGLNAGIATTSGNITITPAAATQMVLAQQPTTAVAGTTFSPVLVNVEDAYGNLVTATSTVTMAVYTGPGPLFGTATATAVNGVATFSDLSIQEAGTYTLRGSDGSLTAVISNAITVTPAAAAQLVFAALPSTAKVNANLSPAVLVDVEDAFGNVVTTDASSVVLSTATGPSALVGTTTAAAVNGVATFTAVSLASAGTYTLSAADGSLAGATSNSFIVSALATTLSLTAVDSTTSTAAAALSFTVVGTGGMPDGETISLLDQSTNTVIATASLSGQKATLLVPAGTIFAGTHSLVAVYTGDTTYAASQSQAVVQTVQVAVTGAVINGNNGALAGAQRSMVDSIVYTFSEPVNVGANAFSIAVHSGFSGTLPTLVWTAINAGTDGSSTQWALTFSGDGVHGGSIANGVYDLTMNGNAVTSGQNSAVVAQARSADTFYRLFGDANGDGTVDSLDTLAFRRSLGTSVGSAGYVASFDYDGNGTVDSIDSLRERQDVGVTYIY